jgi:acetolactate synthase-1/3 small subunit
MVNGSSTVVEQVRKQMDKLVDVVKVFDITGDEKVSRELALIKVRATPTTRSEIIEIVDIFRANIVDVATESVTIEVTGDEDKINSLFELLRGFGIREMARTGCVAMSRGSAGALRVGREQRASPSRRERDLKKAGRAA